MRKYWRFGSGEMYRSAVMRAQLKQLQKYVPDIGIADVMRYRKRERELN